MKRVDVIYRIHVLSATAHSVPFAFRIAGYTLARSAPGRMVIVTDNARAEMGLITPCPMIYTRSLRLALGYFSLTLHCFSAPAVGRRSAPLGAAPAVTARCRRSTDYTADSTDSHRPTRLDWVSSAHRTVESGDPTDV